MDEGRPVPVGHYELLQDFVSPEASVRVIRMVGLGHDIERHVHKHSAQIYVALVGRVGIERDGVEQVIEPYQTLPVPIGTAHGARPIDGDAILMNISVPPLSPDDQSPLEQSADA